MLVCSGIHAEKESAVPVSPVSPSPQGTGAEPARPPQDRRAVFAWCLYDWAYSAFNTVVSTFVIATYFVRGVAIDAATGTTQWATTQAIAGLLIALLAAPLGAIADRGGRRRVLLGGFTAVMATATAGLWFVHPDPHDALLALTLVGIATVAYEIATVFYNAMLTEVAPAGEVGRISGLAWGFGYVGGLICLGTCLWLLINPDPSPLGLDRGQAEHVRAAAVFAAIWIAVFAWPVLVAVPQTSARIPWRHAIRGGLSDLTRILRSAANHPGVARFLFARMIYSDGLTTLFAFGGIFAAGVLGMDAKDVLLLGIGLNVTAGIGALAFAFLEDRIGAKVTVLTSLAALFVLGALVLAAQTPRAFWFAALGLGLFIGPAQAASRSLMAHLAPAETRNAWFGLYALSGRVTGFIGPAALALVTGITGSQRAGMGVILVLLAVGAVLLGFSDTRAAQNASG